MSVPSFCFQMVSSQPDGAHLICFQTPCCTVLSLAYLHWVQGVELPGILSWNNLFLLSPASSGYPTLSLWRPGRSPDIDLIRPERWWSESQADHFHCLGETGRGPRLTAEEEEGGVWSWLQAGKSRLGNCHHSDHCQPGQPRPVKTWTISFSSLRPDIIFPAEELSQVFIV